MPDVTNAVNPVALGIKSPERSFLAVWRIDGEAEVRVPMTSDHAEILYSTDLGIAIRKSEGECVVVFPRPKMGCILSLK